MPTVDEIRAVLPAGHTATLADGAGMDFDILTVSDGRKMVDIRFDATDARRSIDIYLPAVIAPALASLRR